MTSTTKLTILLALGCGSSTTATPAATTPQPITEPAQASVEVETGPPVATMQPTTDSYHGVDVIDPYQWMEDPTSDDVRAWSDGQNQHARRYLASLPNRDAIRARVRAIMAAPSRKHRGIVQRGSKFFAIEQRPPKEQPFLVVMDSLDSPDDARILFDPASVDEGGAVAIDWFVPSHDGELVAVSQSRGGSEWGDVHVYNVATGEQVHEVIEHVNGGTAGGDLAWLPDNSGFFYTRYPREGERAAEDINFFQQLYFHELGKPVTEDRYELGRDLPRIAEIQLNMHAASGRLLVTIQNGDGGEFEMHLRERNGRWKKFSTFDDGAVQAAFGPRNTLYVVSRNEAPKGKIVQTSVRSPNLARARVLVPEGDDSIVTDFWGPPTVVPTANRLYVTYQTGGPSELRVYDNRGRLQEAPTQPPISSIRYMVQLADDSLLMRTESYVTPPVWTRLDTRTGESHATALRETSPVDSSGWEVRRETATSADGTDVPVNIVLPPGIELDGSHPCVVTGYGGYGVNRVPRFRPTTSLYVDAGIIFAEVNLRGGGEFGEEWHRAGSLTQKQNVFDDFAAAIRHMVERRYTSHQRVAIIGGSNGGLLMGATMVQHPELAHAVVSYVGIYDMLRVELSPNGAFNVTEFGTVTNEDHFRALHAYSPYHNVQEASYPATLFLTGANDPRVEPWHSRKMTARLQAAQQGEAPILLRTSETSGHGIGTALSEEIEEETDVIGFIYAQLNVSPPTPNSN